MKHTRSKMWIRIGAICLSLSIVVASIFHVQATEIDDLENKTSGLQSDLSNMKKELEKLVSEIETTTNRLESTREELAIAKGQEQVQYEAMMLRIKYMYENGNYSMLEMLFSSSCLPEFLNRAEFFAKISKHDRDLLNKYEENTKQIAKKEAQLEKDRKYLDSLQEELDEKIDDTAEKLSTYTTKLKKAKEDARKAAEAAKQEIKPVIPETNNSGGSSFGTSYGDPVTVTASDIELLAALLECEAGSSNYEALLAVGSVVVNRMKSSYYPNTLSGVIYQRGQFPPATNGKMDRILARGVKSLCVTAATDALNGKNNVGSCVRFRAASSGYRGTIIGDNVFF